MSRIRGRSAASQGSSAASQGIRGRAAMLCLIALVAAGCSSSGPEKLADRVKRSFSTGRVEDVFEFLSPEQKAAEDVARLREIQGLEDADKEARERELDRMNAEMWWLRDKWTKLESLDDLRKLSAAQQFGYRYNQHAATSKDFRKHVDALQRTTYERRFTDNEEWGDAQIGFSNQWDDRLTVHMIEREGRWYLLSIDVTGFEVRSRPEIERRD